MIQYEPPLNSSHQDVYASTLLKASFEQSLLNPSLLSEAKALLLKIYWIGPDDDMTRIFIAVIHLKNLHPGIGGHMGAICSGISYRLRSAMLDAGALPPPSYLDDFPSAPLMINSDVASCSCAVSYGPATDATRLHHVCLNALSDIAPPSSFFTRHLRLSQSRNGSLERVANTLLLNLRHSFTPHE